MDVRLKNLEQSGEQVSAEFIGSKKMNLEYVADFPSFLASHPTLKHHKNVEKFTIDSPTLIPKFSSQNLIFA